MKCISDPALTADCRIFAIIKEGDFIYDIGQKTCD